MAENFKYAPGETENSLESGVKALTRSLQVAFGVLIVVIVGMLLHYVTFGGYFAVRPQEAVVVLQFGKLKALHTSDWHWYMPYPVNRFVTVKTAPQFLTVNFDQIGTLTGVQKELNPGMDRYILHLIWTIEFHVSDPVKFFESCLSNGDPGTPDEFEYDPNGFNLGQRGVQTLVLNLFKQAVIEVGATFGVNDIYTSQRGAFTAAVERRFAELLRQADAGMTADSVILDKVVPPSRTTEAFNRVQLALNQSKIMRNQADADAVKIRNDGRLRAAGLKADAEAYRKEVVSVVRAESTYFKSIFNEYRKSPETVLMTLLNNTLAEVLSEQDNKYILTAPGKSGSRELRLLLNPEPKKSGASANNSGDK